MSDEYNDIQGFDDEPPVSPVTEPDLNEPSAALDQPTVEPSQAEKINESVSKDGGEEETFEAMSEEELERELNGTSEEIEPTEEQNQTEQENNDYEEISQSKKIMDSTPSEKVDITSKKNKGTFINRTRIITILAFIFVVFILFFTFIFPTLKNKKNKQKTKELDKNGKQYIPNAITGFVEDNEDNVVFEDGNSALQQEDTRSFEEKYPPLLAEQSQKQNNVAPVAVPSSTSSSVEVPITNRNEQQKQPQRLSLSDNSTSATQKTSGSKYPTTTVSGYNTGYNSGYTGTNTTASYTPTSLNDNVQKYLSSMQNSAAYSNNYQMQNNQSGKQEFLNKNGIGGNFQWNSEYSLWKGTIISAVLDTAINTDLPGQIMAHVTKNVYSSQDGRYMLIPEGSRLFGEYNSDISYGQTRIQVVWNTLIRPDGLEINLGSMNGIDSYGHSGYKGWKTDHPFEYVKAFGLIAMYSILDTKMNNYIDSQNNAYAQNALTDVYSETKKLNNKIVDRALDIQPTIRIQSGTEINLITNVTIDLPPLEPYEVEEKYVRN